MTSDSDTGRLGALAPIPATSARVAVAAPLEGRQAPGGWVSPRIGAAEIALVAAAAVILALLTTWPLLAHLSSRIAPDLGDPIRTAWQTGEEGFMLLHHPLHLFQTNAFWPHPNSLTFSDALLGYSPSGLLGSGFTAAVLRYNLLYLFAWSLPLLGAYLLGRELGLGRSAAAIAGAAFTYAPFKAAEAGHLHVISSGAIPVALFCLLRGYRRSSASLVMAGWLVATWQLSLGFTLGLPFSYTLLVLAAIAVLMWWRRGRPALTQAVILATGLGVLLYVAMGLFIARPYLQTAHDYPTAKRAIKEVKHYSATPRAFLAAPFENRVWSAATRAIRYRLSSQNESVLFPGLAITVLAAIGLAGAVYSRRLRLGLLAGTVVFAVLALGLDLTGAGYPYRLLYDHLPGWNGIRVPGRIFSMSALGLALLAGAGAHHLVQRARSTDLRWATRARDLTPLLLAAVLFAAVVYEGAGRQRVRLVPPPPTGTAGLPGPQLWLPTEQSTDRLFQLWSTNGFAAIANGVSTFDIPAQNDLRGGMQNFPDAAGVRKLQQLAIRTVILIPGIASDGLPPQHFAIPEPPDPAAAAMKSIAGLPLTRRRVGSVVVFTVQPAVR